jgi:hypothetical protein
LQVLPDLQVPVVEVALIKLIRQHLHNMHTSSLAKRLASAQTLQAVCWQHQKIVLWSLLQRQ